MSTCYKNIPNVNPIDTLKYRQDLLDSGIINYIFVGNLSRRKGVDLLVDVWPDFHAYVKSELNQQCILTLAGKNHLNISTTHPSIILPGFINPSDLYQSAHFLVMPSVLEGYPKSVSEGISYGCIPIITKQSYNFRVPSMPCLMIKDCTRESVLNSLFHSLTELPSWQTQSLRLINYNATLPSYQNQYIGYVFS